MLNYETLLSAYDDKLTLMQWLKKVEAALKDASAVSFNVNKRGDATLTFSVVFEDGSELESNPITLQQGESVASAYISNGNLHLVLTNGDDLNAGNMFNGDVNIAGALQVNGVLKVNVIDPVSGDNVTFTGGGDFNGDVNVSDGDVDVGDGHVSTPILTSPNDHIEAQKPVVEVMNGYAFAVESKANIVVDCKYAGICKNGNKLTLIVFAELTRTGSVQDNWTQFGYFTIPASIGEKLVTHAITGMTNSVYDEILNCIPAQNTGAIQIYGHVTKPSGNTNLYLVGFNINSLTQDTKYAMRFEATFLLSNNLAA